MAAHTLLLALTIAATVFGLAMASAPGPADPNEAHLRSMYMDTEIAMTKWSHYALETAGTPESPLEQPYSPFPMEAGSPIVEWPASGLKAGANKFLMDRPEGKRTFFVHVPQKYLQNPNASVPLVFLYHGLNNLCTLFSNQLGFEALAEKHNFLYVYPCGWLGLIGVAWNAGTCCNNNPKIDDFTFALQMVQFMNENFSVDKSKIFTSGFSNGAFFSQALACQFPNVFSAAASVAGTMVMLPGNSKGQETCSAAFNGHGQPQQISLLSIHGTLDLIVPFTGNMLLGFPDVPTNMREWSKRNGCSDRTVRTFSKGRYSNQIYEECRGGARVELVKVDLGGHSWLSDNNNFRTTEYIYDFFMNHKRE